MELRMSSEWKAKLGSWALAMGLGLGAGFTWGPKWVEKASAATPFTLEYFTSTATFSEVESARATLEAEASRFVATLRERFMKVNSGSVAAAGRNSVQYTEWLASLKTKLDEFKGTAQEYKIAQEILMVARLANEKEVFLDQYVRVVYEAPAQPLIAVYVKEACETAVELERQGELLRAFSHLLRVPYESENKQKVELALADFSPKQFSFQRTNHRSHMIKPDQWKTPSSEEVTPSGML